MPGLIWRLIGVALVGSALTDVLILVANAAGADHLQAWIISIYAGVMLLAIGVLSLAPAVVDAPADEGDAPSPPPPTAAEGELMDRLDALMTNAAPHLDPDLTLSRLARRLGVPAKQLSFAVNRTTGENVSRYVRAARVCAAQDAIRAGRSVTEAMLSSGFATKSNFNREFLRIVGVPPSIWTERRDDRSMRSGAGRRHGSPGLQAVSSRDTARTNP